MKVRGRSKTGVEGLEQARTVGHGLDFLFDCKDPGKSLGADKWMARSDFDTLIMDSEKSPNWRQIM